LQGLPRIEFERYHKETGKAEAEIRYDIVRLKPDVERLNRSIRRNWGIENRLHWALEVSVREDLDRKRTGHVAQNFSLLNRIALKLLNQEKTCKLGINCKSPQGWTGQGLPAPTTWKLRCVGPAVVGVVNTKTLLHLINWISLLSWLIWCPAWCPL
jgi:predicted transposase YbfD/YdcC